MPITLLSSANGYEPGPIATETQFDRDIVLGLNRSGSMNEYSTDVASWSPGGPGQAYYSSRWRELTSAVAVFNKLPESNSTKRKYPAGDVFENFRSGRRFDLQHCSATNDAG